MVAALSGVLVWIPVPSARRQHPQAQPLREPKKVRVFSFNKALSTLVDTKTHWHVQKPRTMLKRQPNVSLLYVLATASANHESSRVTRKMIATPS